MASEAWSGSAAGRRAKTRPGSSYPSCCRHTLVYALRAMSRVGINPVKVPEPADSCASSAGRSVYPRSSCAHVREGWVMAPCFIECHRLSFPSIDRPSTGLALSRISTLVSSFRHFTHCTALQLCVSRCFIVSFLTHVVGTVRAIDTVRHLTSLTTTEI